MGKGSTLKMKKSKSKFVYTHQPNGFKLRTTQSVINQHKKSSTKKKQLRPKFQIKYVEESDESILGIPSMITILSKSAIQPTHLTFFYDQQGKDWPRICKVGKYQSPIDLLRSSAIGEPLGRIKFHNYNTPLETPAKLRNTGQSVTFSVPPTVNGKTPSISGARMTDVYEAINVHFHWGSANNKGSEHRVDRERFDAEMHIVHRKRGYTQEQALEKSDGFAVLGVMIQITEDPDYLPGIKKIFDALPRVVTPYSVALIMGELTMRQFLGHIDTREYFQYKGSVTTPPCPEGANWMIFPKPLRMLRQHVARLWRLIDFTQRPMINNFRCIQPTNHRRVVFRESF